MAAVLFGFMYFSKPSEEEISAERARQEQLKATTEDTDAAQATGVTFTTADSANLAAAVRLMGNTDGNGASIFSNNEFSLRADSTGLSGTATVDGQSVDIRTLLANRSTLTPRQNAQLANSMRVLTGNAMRYEGFARYLSGESTVTVLENDLMKVSFDSRGARVSQVELKKYRTEVRGDSANVLLFTDVTDGYGFTFNTAEQRINTRDFNFDTTVESDTSVVMTLNPAEGASWSIRYAIAPESYIVKMEIVQEGMSGIIPANTVSMDFNWHQKMGRNELGRTFEERNSAIAYKFSGEGPDELNSGKDDHESLHSRVKWVAFKNQFFSSVIIARDAFSNAELTSVNLKTDRYLKDMTMQASLPYSANDGTAASFDFYFGPNNYPILSSLDKTISPDEDLDLTRLIPLGWGIFRWVNTLIVIPVFTFLGKFISSYGIIILLLTIFIKIILFPFTYKSYKSQARMRVLAPEIKEINEKYPGNENAMKRQQETMALYSRAGASPFSGCLPMLLQMPVLIAMFSFFPSAIELRGQSFLWAHDLSAPDSILTLPFSIPFYGNHVSLFCLLMTIVNVLYMHNSMQNQPGGSSMPGMKVMTYLMPVMFLFIFNDYASGLSYYYFLSLLITIIQTWAVRKFIDEKKVRQQMMENAKKPRKKSGLMARLEEAQRQQQAALRAQQQGKGKKR